MEALEKIQLSEEQIKSLESGKLIAIPATWEEFEEFLVETDYRVEYHNGEVTITGLATLIHKLIVTQLIYLLKGYYLGKPFYVAGSNAGIRKEGQKGHYNGDILVIKGKPDYQGKSRSIIVNPYLIVEVLSSATLDHDLGAKRRKYEQMDTVQEIVFVDPVDKEVIVCRRTERPNVWTETLYNVPTESIDIDGFQLPLLAVFADLPA